MSASAAMASGLDPHVHRALLAAGLDETGVRRAEQAGATSGERPVLAAARLGLVDGARLADAMSQAFALPRARLTGVRGAVPSGMSPVWLRRRRMAVLECDPAGPSLIGVVDPSDGEALKACAFALRGKVRFAVLSLEEWKQGAEEQVEAGSSRHSGASDGETLADLSRGAPAVRLVDEVLAGARRAGASDVHVRPGEAGTAPAPPAAAG